MHLLPNKKTWLITGITLLVVATSLISLWLNNSAASSDAQEAAIQKSPSTISLQATNIITPTAAPVSGSGDPRKSTLADDIALPAIPAEMAAEIRKLSNQTSDDLLAEKNPDGSVSMDLQGHFQSVTAAVRGADGKIIVRHGEDFLANAQPGTQIDNNTNTSPAR